ncbi:MAG: chorismate mutase [Lachnospiraceae bacterium]|nr:chorismate mutase [Lachnospiraceae bacterium]
MEINEIRSKIDKVNDELLSLLLERLSLSREVAEYKINNNLPIYDKKREEEIINALTYKCKDNAEYIIPVFDAILDTSKKLQEDIISEKEGR